MEKLIMTDEKPTKTWREMLNESMQDPDFRKEWEEANAELAELDARLADRVPQREPLPSINREPQKSKSS